MAKLLEFHIIFPSSVSKWADPEEVSLVLTLSHCTMNMALAWGHKGLF